MMVFSGRKGLKYWLTFGLVSLLVLSFILWGVAGSLQSSTPSYVLKVGNRVVSNNKWQRELRRMAISYRLDAGTPLLKNILLQQLLFKNLVLSEADEMNLTISDEVLQMYIAANKGFQNDKGEFMYEKFQKALEFANIAAEDFLEDVREEMLYNTLMSNIFANVKNPKVFSKQLAALDNVYKEVLLYRINKDEIAVAKKIPSEREINSLYQQHKVEFMLPEARDVRYIKFSLDKVSGDISVTSQEVHEFYKKRKHMFYHPERRVISHLIFDNRSSAEDALKSLQGGDALEKVVKGCEAELKRKDDYITYNVLPALLSDKVFEKDNIGYLPVVEIGEKFHVIYVSRIVKESFDAFKDVKDTLLDQLKKEKRLEKLRHIAGDIDRSLAEGELLEKISNSYGFDMKKAVIRKDMAIDDKTLESSSVFKDTIFSIKEGGVSMVAKYDSSIYFVVEVKKIKGSYLPPIAEVKGKLVEIWNNDYIRKHMLEKIEEIRTVLQSGKEPEQRGEVANVYFTKDKAHNLPQEFLEKDLLPAKVNSITRAFKIDPREYIVGKILSIKMAEGNKRNGKVEDDPLVENQLYHEFEQYLRSKYPTEINWSVLK